MPDTRASDSSHLHLVDDDDRGAHIGVAWERGDPPHSGPIAVEFTLTAPDAAQSGRSSPAPRLLNVGLAIDRSGSMAGAKLAAARRSAAGVLDALRDGERFAAAAFDTEVSDVSPSVALTDDARARIRLRLATLEAGSSTALFDGFRRAAELVAHGGSSNETASWVIVLSDGMGNHGLTDPAAMKVHAAALADRGIRTIAVGIGEEYLADQLTALADGGGGEFHHASNPGEIVEIVLGELRSLRTVAASDIRVHVNPGGAGRMLLLGGEVADEGGGHESRFDRLGTGRTLRVVALLWPDRNGRREGAAATVSWLDGEQRRHERSVESARPASGPRDTALALRASRLWQAQIIARALELNERGEYESAARFVRRSVAELAAYADDLPERAEILAPMAEIGERVGHAWATRAHKELYAMSRFARRGKVDYREDAPATYLDALKMDER